LANYWFVRQTFYLQLPEQAIIQTLASHYGPWREDMPSSSGYEMMLEDLERDLLPLDRQRSELITTINVIRAKAGLPPRDGGNSGGTGGVTDATAAVASKIRSDSFVGKRLRSASKEYLTIRRAQGLDGPATPREIYDALINGGFEFASKDETIRLISLRNMLRKRSEVFKKFDDTGKYGLNEWYGIVRKSKVADAADDGEGDGDDEGAGDTTEVKKEAAAGTTRRRV
jgi:hypothetical protein